MLGALIAAVREADDDAVPIATLPVGGRTLVERQVRLAATAGATHIVILVERLPPPLTAAIDRLRRDGIEVDVARSAHDGADRFHPDERVLILADGALPPAGCVRRLAALPAPVLLTIGEDGPAGTFERIDSATRWTGVALVGGDMLRRTVAQLGDWDLHSTLLRRAAGSGARRLDVADGADLAPAEPTALVRSRAGARAATASVLAPDRRGEAWPMRFLYMPAARIAIGALLDRPVEGPWLRIAALGVTLAASPILWAHWLAAALALLVLGALLEGAGRLLDAIRLGRARPRDRLGLLREGAIALTALIWAARSYDDAGVVPLVLVASTILVMVAARRETGLMTRLVGRAAPAGVADADALVLLFAAAVALGFTASAPAAVLVYAASSFAAIQHRFSRKVTPPAAPAEV
ncbi:hypothetical protein [Sphingomonas sp.]|uniref:hypothetical protein n=1 Tax=Sphingomonas sp. TaxID=28214 RepID=UPI003AFFCC14